MYAWFCVGFVIAQVLGHTFLYGVDSISVLWPPTGVLGATLVITHWRHWAPILVLAGVIDFSAGLVWHVVPGDRQFLYYLIVGLITNPLMALSFALLCRRTIVYHDPLSGPAAFGVYVSAPILLASGLVSFIAMSMIALFIDGFSVLSAWPQWWYSEVTGLLAFATPILVISARPSLLKHLDDRIFEASAALVIFAALTYVFFARPASSSLFRYYQVLLMLPVMAWIVARFGPVMMTLVTMVLTLTVLLGMISHTGPFEIDVRSPQENVIAAQGVLVPTMLALLFIASILESQRRHYAARLQTERQLRSLDRIETLGTMAGGVAHDFGNLAIAIRAYQSILRSQLPEPAAPVAKAIAGLEEVADGAQSLTRSLMTFARDDAKESDQAPQAADLCESVRACISALQPLVGTRHTLASRVPATPLYVGTSTGNLQRMLSNMIINAGDASEKGSQISVTVRQHVDGVRLIVEDEGCGISPEAQKRIFDPFYTTKPRGKGTGLGLAVVAGLVRDMRGEIDVASSPGVGTTITITLPTLSREAYESIRDEA